MLFPSNPQIRSSQPALDNNRSRPSSPAPAIIPNPSIPGNPAPSAELLFNAVDTFAKHNGLGIIRRNTHTSKGRKVKYPIQCDRFGKLGPTQGAGLRQRKSRRCGCKWIVIAEAKVEGQWLLRAHARAEHSQHNPGPSIDPAADPSHQRISSPVQATIESTSRRVAIWARDVRAVAQKEYPESIFTQRDIYNTRARLNRDQLGSYSSTAALIKLFNEREVAACSELAFRKRPPLASDKALRDAFNNHYAGKSPTKIREKVRKCIQQKSHKPAISALIQSSKQPGSSLRQTTNTHLSRRVRVQRDSWITACQSRTGQTRPATSRLPHPASAS